jgi:hypothetical protein
MEVLAAAAVLVLVIWFIGYWRFHEARRHHPPSH